MKKIRLWSGLLMLPAFFSCRESYNPDLKSSATRLLVVEGVLDPGADPTTVLLTRTSDLDNSAFVHEANAIVTVEGKDNTSRALTYAGTGNYRSPGLNLTIGNEYRLRIRTTNGKEYLSAWVQAKQAPAIDSIGWKRNDEGVQIYADAHDPSGNTRYYRWDYDETWEIRTFYYSSFIYIKSNNTVRDRTSTEDVSRCWKYRYSSSIALASSERLQSDIISQAPVNFIASGDERLCVRYSILLRQYALDKAGYEFYELMKRNTENLGSIFDPQPSEIKGNIACVTDPEELVIGYVSASTVAQKRVFISNAALPGWRLFEYCPEIRVANHPDSIRDAFYAGTYAPFSATYSPVTGNIDKYISSTPDCVDCTERGGSTVRPTYW